MTKIMLQLQLLLAALSALLPLLPSAHRAKAADVLDLAARALAFGHVVTTNVDDLAQKLAAVRAEVEAMAAAGVPVSDEKMDAAMACVRAASAAFREARAATEGT